MKKIILTAILISIISFIVTCIVYFSSGTVEIDLSDLVVDEINNENKQLIVHISDDTFTLEFNSIERTGNDLEYLLDEYEELSSNGSDIDILIHANKEIAYLRMAQSLSTLKLKNLTKIQINTSDNE